MARSWQILCIFVLQYSVKIFSYKFIYHELYSTVCGGVVKVIIFVSRVLGVDSPRGGFCIHYEMPLGRSL